MRHASHAAWKWPLTWSLSLALKTRGKRRWWAWAASLKVVLNRLYPVWWWRQACLVWWHYVQYGDGVTSTGVMVLHSLCWWRYIQCDDSGTSSLTWSGDGVASSLNVALKTLNPLQPVSFWHLTLPMSKLIQVESKKYLTVYGHQAKRKNRM